MSEHTHRRSMISPGYLFLHSSTHELTGEGQTLQYSEFCYWIMIIIEISRDIGPNKFANSWKTTWLPGLGCVSALGRGRGKYEYAGSQVEDPSVWINRRDQSCTLDHFRNIPSKLQGDHVEGWSIIWGASYQLPLSLQIDAILDDTVQ